MIRWPKSLRMHESGKHRALPCLAASLLLSACATAPKMGPAPAPAPPPDVSKIPDVAPKQEPRSAKGNPPFYEVFGKRYFVLPTAAGYVERGVASWYGPGFHSAYTSNGERYDMYGMTAAHKTLPLPSYVQVTNLSNGRIVVVRVNDRGPFKDGRIIDLSHTAAAKLDILKAGTAFVEVKALTPGATAPTPLTAQTLSSELYVQAGAFSEQGNADKLAEKLRTLGHRNAFVREDRVADRSLFRVRIGPVATVPLFDRMVKQLKSLGIGDAHLALD